MMNAELSIVPLRLFPVAVTFRIHHSWTKLHSLHRTSLPTDCSSSTPEEGHAKRAPFTFARTHLYLNHNQSRATEPSNTHASGESKPSDVVDASACSPTVAFSHAFAAANWYFTPQSMASLYAGAGYWAQITARDGADRGSILGLAGLEAALSSRATVFVEGGWGLGLTKTDDGATRQRFVARLGVRVKL